MARHKMTFGSRGGGVVRICVWINFEVLAFNVILGSFSALVSKCSVTRQRLSIEWSGMKYGTWCNGRQYTGYLWPFSDFSVSAFGVIQCIHLKMAFNSKTVVRRAKRSVIGASRSGEIPNGFADFFFFFFRRHVLCPFVVKKQRIGLKFCRTILMDMLQIEAKIWFWCGHFSWSYLSKITQKSIS